MRFKLTSVVALILLLAVIMLLLLTLKGWLLVPAVAFDDSKSKSPNSSVLAFANGSAKSVTEQQANEENASTTGEADIISCGDAKQAPLLHKGALTDEKSAKKLLAKLSLESENSQIRLASLFNQSGDLPKKLETLAGFVRKSQWSKLAFSRLLVTCGRYENFEVCDSKAIEQMSEVDSGNGSMWLNLAVLRLKFKDTLGAIDALELATNSPEFNEYWSESISLMDNALLAAGLNNPVERTELTMKLSANGFYPNTLEVTDFCAQNAGERADLAVLCLELGKRLYQSTKTTISRNIGVALQQEIYRKLGDAASAEELEATKTSLNQIFSGKKLNKASELMLWDSQLLDFWFQQVRIFGELKAYSLLVEEAERLSKDPNYDPCSG